MTAYEGVKRTTNIEYYKEAAHSIGITEHFRVSEGELVFIEWSDPIAIAQSAYKRALGVAIGLNIAFILLLLFILAACGK